MSTARPSLTIRSFRLAFELERRIHKIDRFRLPLPYGLPLRSLAYAVAALGAVLLFATLPVFGAALEMLPWPVRFGVVPVAAAQLLTQINVDGRPAHEVVAAWLRLRLGPRCVVGWAAARRGAIAAGESFVVAPDERGTAYRRGRVIGSGSVLLRRQATATACGHRLLIAAVGSDAEFRGKRVLLKPGQEVVLR
jgi:hypothetical protein